MSTVRRPRVQREQEQQRDEQDILTFLPEENQPLLESRVIRRFAVQSTALAGLHLLGGAILGVISLLVGSVPYLGFLMRLLGWLIYIAVALISLLLRFKLMEHAWHGRRFALPLVEKLIHKFY